VRGIEFLSKSLELKTKCFGKDSLYTQDTQQLLIKCGPLISILGIFKEADVSNKDPKALLDNAQTKPTASPSQYRQF
jgi:hypothetical protein